jgi:hypothetical protein
MTPPLPHDDRKGRHYYTRIGHRFARPADESLRAPREKPYIVVTTLAVVMRCGGRHVVRRLSYGRGGVKRELSHGFPYLHGAVNTGGGDGSAVGRPGHGSDVTDMAQVGSNGVAGNGVPDVDSFVVTGGSEIVAVG